MYVYIYICHEHGFWILTMDPSRSQLPSCLIIGVAIAQDQVIIQKARSHPRLLDDGLMWGKATNSVLLVKIGLGQFGIPSIISYLLLKGFVKPLY